MQQNVSIRVDERYTCSTNKHIMYMCPCKMHIMIGLGIIMYISNIWLG